MKSIASITLAAALAAAAPASAHIVLAEDEAAPGAYYAGFFRVGHGCGDEPTTRLRIEIPEGIYTARPQPKPGWRISVERETLPEPVTVEGEAITERVSAITWRGRLSPERFDQFGVLLKLPEATGPLYFPTTQTCPGAEQRWIEIPPAGAPWGSVAHPAPILTILAPEGEGEAHVHAH